jgi:hypothetical protein
MGLNLIDSIANDLAKIKKDSDYSQANPKYYTSSGIILEPYAKLNKLSVESLRNIVKTNSFFKLSSGTIQTGLFSKRDKKVEVIELEDTQLIRKEFIQNPDKILKESSASSLLTQIMLQITLEERSKVALTPKPEAHKEEYDYPQEDRILLYEKYFPEELDKYQREGRSESNLEKKFNKRVAPGSELHFSDGKVAHNLLTWFQCIQMASPDIIAKHIRNNDFSNWLEDKVKAPELVRICVKIAKRIQYEEIAEKEVKNELLSGITKTSLNNIIFDTIILPLIRKVKSTDQSQAEEAIDKLLMLNDSRVVEPLLDRIFDSQPKIRNKIIIGMGKLGDKRATPTLLKIVKHTKDNQERLIAVQALGNLNDRRALTTLKEFAKEKNEVGAAATKILNDGV